MQPIATSVGVGGAGNGATGLEGNVHVKGLAACLIADDLTGACDAAVAFAVRGLQTHVALHQESLPQAEVIALCTNSRDVATETARERIRSAVEFVYQGEPYLLFKKIDSTFRGNTCDEIGTFLDVLPHKFAILAPACPLLGRRVRGGRVVVDDLAGHSVLDLPCELLQRNIKFQILARGDPLTKQMARAKKDGLRLIVCDTETEQDLDAIVNAGTSSGLDLVWLGSSGLAHALASVGASSNQRTSLPPLCAGVTLFCIGSDHRASIEQVLYLKRERTVAEVRLGPKFRDELGLALKRATDILLHIDDCRSDLGQSSLRAIRDVFRPQAEHRISTLVLSGGDTAATVCEVLEVQSIEMRTEVLPGIPCGVIRGGTADGLTVVTKSGGFGGENALLQVAYFFEHEARRVYEPNR